MNELVKLANDKMNARAIEISRDLSKRVGASYAELASKGQLKSGSALLRVADDCAQAYDEMVVCINAEISWIFEHALYVTETSALSLTEMGLGHIRQIESVVLPQIDRISQTAQGGAEAQHAIRMQAHGKKEESEEAIRFFVRQRRIEKPRGLLRAILRPLFSLLTRQKSS